MAQLGCTCGHRISDTRDNNPIKGYILRDVSSDRFFQELSDLFDDIVKASHSNRLDSWQLENGFPQYYVDLKLSPGNIFHDMLAGRFNDEFRDILECEKCGRVWIETSIESKFESYSPDNNQVNYILASNS